MKPLYLDFVNKGVANRFDLEKYELIEMNDNLRKYPDLFYKVLMHELSHEDGSYKPKDFTHDMKSKTPGLFKFMIKHPLSFTQVLPFYWDMRRNKLVYDISVISSWIMALSIGAGVFFGLRWIL